MIERHEFVTQLGHGRVLPLSVRERELLDENHGAPNFSPILSSDAMRQTGELPSDIIDRAEGVIYMVLNILDGSRYIGATAISVEKRWYNHVKKAKRVVTSPLHYDLNRRGQQAFEVYQIASCLYIEELAALEAECIEQYKPEYNRAVPEDIWEYLR